jgi:hypothetical protein
MNEEPVRLGRISRGMEKALGKDFGDDIWIYVTGGDLDRLASHWPTNYLARLEECGRILKNPDYLAYAEKEELLYFIKEYFKDNLFKKVVVILKNEKQWHLKELVVLDEPLLNKITSESLLKRVN